MSSAGIFATARRGGVDDYEMSQILSLRARGVGIQNIANMLGRPASTVEAFLAPVLQAVTPSVRQPPTPDAEPVAWERPSGGVYTHDIRAILDRIVTEECARAYMPEEAMFSYSCIEGQPAMRWAAYYRASLMTGLTHTALGKYFNRSLTSITRGIKAHIERPLPEIVIDLSVAA